jgi:hypothetical protein
MKKALCIIKKYPPPMIIRVKETKPEPKKIIIKQTDVIFCPIWIRKFF